MFHVSSQSYLFHIFSVTDIHLSCILCMIFHGVLLLLKCDNLLFPCAWCISTALSSLLLFFLFSLFFLYSFLSSIHSFLCPFLFLSFSFSFLPFLLFSFLLSFFSLPSSFSFFLSCLTSSFSSFFLF